MSHVWMSHVTRMNESCHTYEWVMAHVWMSHVTRMNESCHTYEWVMSHVWLSHVTGEQCDEQPRRTSLRGGSGFICVTWLIHMCDMTHSYVWHDSFICVTWLIHMWDMTHRDVCHDSCICVADSFICVTWRIHVRDLTHSNVRHDSFMCVIWLIYICAMQPWRTCLHVRFGVICVAWLIYLCDIFLILWIQTQFCKKDCTHIIVVYCRRVYKTWIDWFWLRGWLINKKAISINKGAICTRTAPLFWNFISLLEGPRTRLVRKIGSQNQSIRKLGWITHIHVRIGVIGVAWLIYTCDMTHAHVRHDPFTYWMSHAHEHEWVMSCTYMTLTFSFCRVIQSWSLIWNRQAR